MAERVEEFFDLGDMVKCDFCGEDHTESDAVGGFLFGSKAVCPSCVPRAMPKIKLYGEEHLIRDRAKDGETFRAFCLRLRDGNNMAKVRYDPNNPQDVAFVANMREYFKR